MKTKAPLPGELWKCKSEAGYSNWDYKVLSLIPNIVIYVIPNLNDNSSSSSYVRDWLNALEYKRE